MGRENKVAETREERRLRSVSASFKSLGHTLPHPPISTPSPLHHHYHTGSVPLSPLHSHHPFIPINPQNQYLRHPFIPLTTYNQYPINPITPPSLLPSVPLSPHRYFFSLAREPSLRLGGGDEGKCVNSNEE